MKLIENAQNLTLANDVTVEQSKTNDPTHSHENKDHYTEMFTIHACAMTLAWTVLNFTGFYYARYKRSNPNWIFIHQICNGLAGAMAMLSGFGAIQLCKRFVYCY
jgi:heme/copper-type cytochrome/quinol oxidase subunit 1